MYKKKTTREYNLFYNIVWSVIFKEYKKNCLFVMISSAFQCFKLVLKIFWNSYACLKYTS